MVRALHHTSRKGHSCRVCRVTNVVVSGLKAPHVSCMDGGWIEKFLCSLGQISVWIEAVLCCMRCKNVGWPCAEARLTFAAQTYGNRYGESSYELLFTGSF